MNTSLQCSHDDLEAQPTLFVDLAHNVFCTVRVDDLIMGSSSQLYDVVAEMKQHFKMKVTHPLSASSTQTYVGARYLRHNDASWSCRPHGMMWCQTCGHSGSGTQQ